MSETTLRFTATDEKGLVSALLNRPEDSRAVIVLAHGAGANMHHSHMQFLNGTRDSLAERDLLEGVIRHIAGAELHWLETADHSFKILKRSRRSTEDVYDEAARVAVSFVDRLV